MTESLSGVRRTRLPIEELVVDPLQSRDEAWTGDEQDQQLASSVASTGLLQDIIVRPIEQLGGVVNDVDESYAIVAGSRRYQAALDAGYEDVPCKILALDDFEAAWTSLLENTDRSDLSEQEVAEQLGVIYELIRPLEEPEACPECGVNVAGEDGLTSHWGQSDCDPPAVESAPVRINEGDDGRFASDRQARRYLAHRYLGRTDETAVQIIGGHLRTAQLPTILQSLFKSPDDRSEQERTALANYGIDADTTLGSGTGRSKASQVVSSIHDTIDREFAAEAIDPTTAVLEAVGSLRTSDISEKEFEKSLRKFRRELKSEVATEASTDEQRRCFDKVLADCAEEQRTFRDELDAARPFNRVDVRAPESERHNRWYARAHERRDVRSHGELIRELYQTRLETLADEQGWE
jgi:hypothetical protein